MGFRFPLTCGGSGKHGSTFSAESKLGCDDKPPHHCTLLQPHTQKCHAIVEYYLRHRILEVQLLDKLECEMVACERCKFRHPGKKVLTVIKLTWRCA